MRQSNSEKARERDDDDDLGRIRDREQSVVHDTGVPSACPPVYLESMALCPRSSFVSSCSSPPHSICEYLSVRCWSSE